MLSAYYSRGYEGQNIFDNLKISETVSFAEYLNKYDVIYIDMNTIDGLFDGYSNKTKKADGVNDLVDYVEYSIIRELKSSKVKFFQTVSKNIRLKIQDFWKHFLQSVRI
jgi:hypothetical protein